MNILYKTKVDVLLFDENKNKIIGETKNFEVKGKCDDKKYITLKFVYSILTYITIFLLLSAFLSITINFSNFAIIYAVVSCIIIVPILIFFLVFLEDKICYITKELSLIYFRNDIEKIKLQNIQVESYIKEWRSSHPMQEYLRLFLEKNDLNSFCSLIECISKMILLNKEDIVDACK